MKNKYYIKYGYFGHCGKRYINWFQAVGFYILGALVRTVKPDGCVVYWCRDLMNRKSPKEVGEYERR